MKFNTILALISYLLSASADNDCLKTKGCNVEMAVVLYQTGESGPEVEAIKRGHQFVAENWLLGGDQLTLNGIKEAYGFGKFLRNRYNNLLIGQDKNANYAVYSPTQVKISSQDSDPCISSAQALSAGLYQPAKNVSWDPRIAWLPTPVYTSGQGDKETSGQLNLLGGGMNCDKFIAMSNSRFTLSAPINQWEKTNSKLIQAVHDGKVNGKRRDENLFERLYGFYVRVNAILRDYDKNIKSGPSWVNAKTIKTLRQFKKLWFEWVYGTLSHDEQDIVMHYLATGKLLAKINGQTKDGPKLIIYAGDVNSMAALASSMKIYDEKWLKPGTGLLIEMLSFVNDANDRIVRVSRKGLSGSLIDIPINKFCTNTAQNPVGGCKLKSFRENIDKILTTGKSKTTEGRECAI